MPEMTENMSDDYLQCIIAESQPEPPYQQAHYLTPPDIKGRGLAADATAAVVKATGPRTLASIVSQKCHQSKKEARQVWVVWWHAVMHTAQGVGTEGSGEEREGRDEQS